MSTETGRRLSLIVPLLGHWHGGDGIKLHNLCNFSVGSEKGCRSRCYECYV